MPFEIDMSPNFEIVKYAFLDFQQYENDRLIPWKGNGLYSGMDQEPALTFQRNQTLKSVPTAEAHEPAAMVVNLNNKDG